MFQVVLAAASENGSDDGQAGIEGVEGDDEGAEEEVDGGHSSEQ